MPHAGRKIRDLATWPGRALVVLALAGLGVSAGADDWKVDARGIVTVQTSLSGSQDSERGKFQPGLRAEVIAPIVIGSQRPHAIADAVARLAIVDFPQPGQQASASAKPAATFALALEHQIGRGKLAGPEPAQRVATAIGIEGGYASTLSGQGSSKWVMAVARVTEERDGLELRFGGGYARVGDGSWHAGAIAGLSVPLKGPLSWLWVGADATFLHEGDSVQAFIGAGFR